MGPSTVATDGDNVRVQEAAVGVIFAATILGLYARPFGAKDWHIASAGGLLAWAAGPLSFGDGVEVIGDAWNIILFFLGLMLLAAGAEACGLYAMAARLLERQGEGRRQTAAVLAIGTPITVVLSNDATPLVMTPAIFEAGRQRKVEPRDAAFAAAFIANCASLVLPVSNPVNLLFYERFEMSFSDYASTAMVAGVAETVALWLAVLARRPVRHASRSAATAVNMPEVSPGLQRAAVVVTGMLAPVYVGSAVAGVPLGIVSIVGGLVMLGLLLAHGSLRLSEYRRHIALGLFPFICGLLVLVDSGVAVGLLDPVTEAFKWLSSRPEIIAILGSASIAALLANVLNNWPSALLVAATIGASTGQHEPLIAGALIGSTIGANYTMVGALSTVFWLTLTRKEGAVYTPGMYARRAFVPTTLAVAAACMAAWVV